MSKTAACGGGAETVFSLLLILLGVEDICNSVLKVLLKLQIQQTSSILPVKDNK